MATRSAIGIADSDKITAVYCHWDGYLDGVGECLLEHWTARGAVRQLISMGDISSLGACIGLKHDFDGVRPPGETTFYGRDRGEVDTAAVDFGTAEEFVKEMSHRGSEYFYIFGTDNQWWVSCKFGPLAGTWTLLSQAREIVAQATA